MMKRALAIPLLLGCTCATLSCTQDRLLGEDGCFGTNTECTSDVPTLTQPSGENRGFDVVASSTIKPRWVFERQCDELCFAQIEPAPDGSLWAFLDEESGGTLLEVDTQGQLAHSSETNFGGTLFVDRELNAELRSWNERNVRIERFAPGGERSEKTLSLGLPRATDTTQVSIDASDDSSVIANFEKDSAWVAKYDAKGDLIWKQTALRAARRYPFQDLGAGLSVPIFFDLVPLSDGSLALGMLKYLGPEPDEHALLQRYRGISMLDADGNIRWDVAIENDISYRASIPLLSAAPDGGIVFVTTGEQDYLRVGHIDGKSGTTNSWTGVRLGYFAATPFKMCVDPESNIYVVVLTGERNTGKYTLCKMSPGHAEAPVQCAALELPPEFRFPFDGGQLLSPSLTGMACPAPGEVVLSATPSDDPTNGPRRVLLVGLSL